MNTNRGNLNDRPLAEVIRELAEASASGALRLSRERAKAVVYFESGEVAFVASNIRAHRLAEFLKRTGILDETAAGALSAKATDDEILNHLVESQRLPASRVNPIRASHVADVLRGVLLWTDGDWQFDQRVRIAGNTRVRIDVPRLLLESTRHLPAAYVAARFGDGFEQFKPAQSNGQTPDLLPAEAFVLSRLTAAMTLNELLALSGMNEAETLQSLYALITCGAVKRTASRTPVNSSQATSAASTATAPPAQTDTLEEFIARAETDPDHYEMLGVARQAGLDKIKNAYHSLARRYHPDRFHKADAQMRARIESAFARVARAYEVLGDQTSRATYDAQFASALDSSTGAARESSKSPTQRVDNRAEASFQSGVAAMKKNQIQQAVRFFAEAASLDPQRARYRAEYGRALTNDPTTRRLAEIELKAAIALEPGNTSYRVALAELYKALGLRRRAEGELQRALAADPKNSAARGLLASLKN